MVVVVVCNDRVRRRLVHLSDGQVVDSKSGALKPANSGMFRQAGCVCKGLAMTESRRVVGFQA